MEAFLSPWLHSPFNHITSSFSPFIADDNSCSFHSSSFSCHSEPRICFTMNSWPSSPFSTFHVDSWPVAIHKDIDQNLEAALPSLDQSSMHCLVSLCLIGLLSTDKENLCCICMLSSCNCIFTAVWQPINLSYLTGDCVQIMTMLLISFFLEDDLFPTFKILRCT